MQVVVMIPAGEVAARETPCCADDLLGLLQTVCGYKFENLRQDLLLLIRVSPDIDRAIIRGKVIRSTCMASWALPPCGLFGTHAAKVWVLGDGEEVSGGGVLPMPQAGSSRRC